MNALVEKPVGDRDAIAARIPYSPRIAEVFGVDDRTWKVLVESTYPEAKSADSVGLALSYCRTRKLDVLKKPVHIVPVWNSNLRKMVETVWPSLNLYRIEAARTGEYAGIDDAVFGPTIEEEMTGTIKQGNGNVEVTKTVRYPEWCQITVYRVVKGTRCAFKSPRVYWKEYYASAGRDSALPNAQWAQRPFYMIEKVAESQALRRAFPEECSDPTAEEMAAAGSPPPVYEEPTSALDRLRDAKATDPVQDAPEPPQEPRGRDIPDDIEDAEFIPEDPHQDEPERPVDNAPREQDEAPQEPEPEQPEVPSLPAGIDPMHDEFTAGAKSYQAGENIGSCPHDELNGPDARHWIAGFNYAKKKAGV